MRLRQHDHFAPSTVPDLGRAVHRLLPSLRWSRPRSTLAGRRGAARARRGSPRPPATGRLVRGPADPIRLQWRRPRRRRPGTLLPEPPDGLVDEKRQQRKDEDHHVVLTKVIEDVECGMDRVADNVRGDRERAAQKSCQLDRGPPGNEDREAEAHGRLPATSTNHPRRGGNGAGFGHWSYRTNPAAVASSWNICTVSSENSSRSLPSEGELRRACRAVTVMMWQPMASAWTTLSSSRGLAQISSTLRCGGDDLERRRHDRHRVAAGVGDAAGEHRDVRGRAAGERIARPRATCAEGHERRDVDLDAVARERADQRRGRARLGCW